MLTKPRKPGGNSISIDSRVSALTAGEFYCIREVLEQFGDLSILADVLKQATGCEDNMVLASASDTINYHFDAFCVIGATSDLFRGLIGSYARLKRYGTLNLEFVFSLIELGLRIPDESSTVALLRQDLALAAPSPLSDHIPAAFSDVDASFQDKLDQLLSSGNGIDESSMATVFKSLTKILENGSNLAKLSANDACRYLAYLRPFNPKYFDLMLVRWVCGLLKSTSRPAMSRILPPLIGVGCVTIQSFVSLVKKLLASEKASPVIPELASLRLDLLQLLAPREESNTDLVRVLLSS
jgi:mediator of RNA polymerase II transcription subunit 12